MLVADAIVGALIAATTGVVAGVLFWVFCPAKPCPDCKKPLPRVWAVPPKLCPHCGCALNNRGNRRQPWE